MKTLAADKFYGVKEARQNFTEIVKQAHELLQRFIITNRGEPEAVVMSIDEYEDLLEVIEDLSNPELIDEIAEARKAYAATGGIDFDQYRKGRKAKK